MKVISLREAIKPHAPKILLYGESGVGKTTLAASLPGRVLIVSAEAGLLSLSFAASEDRFGVVEVEDVNTLRAVYRALKQPGHGWDWVVLDSLSEIAEVLLAAAKKTAADPRQAYGAIIDEVTSLVRSFRDLDGIGALIVAKAGKTKDEVSGRVMVGPSMPGAKLGDALPYLFDEVFRLVVVDEVDPESKTRTPVRWLQTQADARSVCKDRSGALEALEPADLGAIVDKIMAHADGGKVSTSQETGSADTETDEETAQ
jgi:hypothetical protein